MRTKITVCLFLIVQVFSVYSQEFTWATSVSGSDTEIGVKMVKDSSGDIYIIGHSRSNPFIYEGISYPTNGNGGDAFFAKLDTNKELVWMKSMGGNDQIYFDKAIDIHIDTFGDIYLSVNSTGENFRYDGLLLSGIDSPGQYSGEAVLIKVNSNGDYIWHDSGTASSSLLGMTTDTNGNLYVTGYFARDITLGGVITLTNPSSGTTIDLLVAKYQPDGTILWAKNAGGTPHNTFAYGIDIEINPQSNEIIVLAKGDGDVYFDGVPMPVNNGSDEGNLLVSYGADGTQNWIKRILDDQDFGYGDCNSIGISSSGIIGVCGWTNGTTAEGLVGFYDNQGFVISEHTYPSGDDLLIHSIAFNEFGEVYLSGRCNDGAVLGISPGTVTLTDRTGFIVKMDTQQQVAWVTEFESYFESRVFYDNGSILYACTIGEDFIYNSGQDIIIPDSGDAVFAEMPDNTLGVDNYIAEPVSVYPNPTSGLLVIETNSLQHVKVYDIRGILLETSDNNEIDLSQYSRGVYLIKIITDKGTTVKKVILK